MHRIKVASFFKYQNIKKDTFEVNKKHLIHSIKLSSTEKIKEGSIKFIAILTPNDTIMINEFGFGVYKSRNFLVDTTLGELLRLNSYEFNNSYHHIKENSPVDSSTIESWSN